MAPNSGNTKNLANLAGPHNFMDGNGKRLGDVYPEFGKGQPCGSVLAEFTGAIKIIADKIENEDLSGFDIKRLKSWYNIFTRSPPLILFFPH